MFNERQDINFIMSYIIGIVSGEDPKYDPRPPLFSDDTTLVHKMWQALHRQRCW